MTSFAARLLVPARSHAQAKTSVPLPSPSAAQNSLDESAPQHPIPQAPYVQIALDRAQSGIDRELTYAIPDDLRATLTLGFAVLVPVGRQNMTGYVTGFTNTLDFDAAHLKAVTAIVSRSPVFDARALKVARWMSAYYHCPLNECLACCVPGGWQLSSERRFSLTTQEPNDVLRLMRDMTRAPRQLQIIQFLSQSERGLTLKDFEKATQVPLARLSQLLNMMLESGIVQAHDEVAAPEVKPRRVAAVRPHAQLQAEPLNEAAWQKLEKTAPRQAEALHALLNFASQAAPNTLFPTSQLAREAGIELAALRGLEKKQLVEFVSLEQARAPRAALIDNAPRIQLTDEQTQAVQGIARALKDAFTQTSNPKPQTLLLQGVTASGKTEVYLHAIEKCLEAHRRALVMVPEIALTAQTVEIFQKRFGERVAILHSALSPGERFDEWRRIRSGKAEIVVGARSAVFAPCRDVGLIIIDEEHDGSYKQDAMPRYHARDVALKRASLEGAVVVLGSATPSLETYQRAIKGEYGHLTMTRRVASRPMPDVQIVDMTTEARAGVLPVLSNPLKRELLQVVGRGEQAIIFLNRRGFATYVQCIGCGHVEKCPNCDVTLTFHKAEDNLRCHHCDHEAPRPSTCPECQSWMIGFTGTGTEKVEAEVASFLQENGQGEAKILRLDRDTTSTKGAHGKIVGEFRRRQAQILIGTQMVTKGLDFPGVTLVGVINADTALNVPDFRAAERTFQLLAQVAGRAGRGETPGRVLIQTLAMDHYAVEAARAQDFESFVKQELKFRRNPVYPPFAHVVNVISQDESQGKARARIESLAMAFSEAIARESGGDQMGTEILGPVDCPLGRVKNKFRFHLMLRDRNRPRLHRVLSVYDNLPREEREGLIVDVDAMTML